MSVIVCLSVLIAQSSTTFAGWQEIKDRITGLTNKLQPYKVASNAALAVCVGFVANKFLPLKEIAVGAASLGLAGASVYGYKYLQHGHQLDNIRRTLDESGKWQSLYNNQENSISNLENIFRFCTWRQNSTLQWKSAKEIYDNKDNVHRLLMIDARSNGFPILHENGKQINSVFIKAHDIRNDITREQEKLESYLREIDTLTNISPLFIKHLRDDKELKKICDNSLDSQSKVFQCTPQLITVDTKTINLLLKSIKQGIKNRNAWIIMPSYNPLRWSIACQTNKAAHLYCKVYKSYLRLHALKNALENK